MTKYSEEELIEEIQRVSEEHCDGGTPTIDDMKSYSKYSITPYRNSFGRWNSAIEEAGFTVNQPSRKPIEDKDQLKREIKRLDNNNNIPSPPRAKDMTNHGNYAANTYKRTFGSWNEAIESAGINKRTSSKRVSEKEIKKDIKRVIKKLEKVPKGKEYDEHGKYHSSTIYSKIGSFSKAIESLGYEAQRKVYEDSELKEEMKRVIKKVERYPTKSEWEKISDISREPYLLRWGTWLNAVAEIKGVERVKIKMPSGEDSTAWKGGSEVFEDYGNSWLKKRNNALKRDSFKCRLCGSERSTENLTNPDVHHITPIRYWKIEKEHEKMNHLRNLICLCRSCHRKLEGKFKGRNHEEFEKLAKDYLDIEETEEKKGIFDY